MGTQPFILDNYLDISGLQYVLFTQLLTIIGMYGIFNKVGERSILAFVPYVHWVKLGELLGCEKLGLVTAITGILRLAMMQMSDTPKWDVAKNVIMTKVTSVGTILFFVLYTVFSIMMFYRLLYNSGKSKWYLVPFAILPGCTLAYFGVSRRIQVEL